MKRVSQLNAASGYTDLLDTPKKHPRISVAFKLAHLNTDTVPTSCGYRKQGEHGHKKYSNFYQLI